MSLSQFDSSASQNLSPVLHDSDIKSACNAFETISDVELSFIIPATRSVNLDPGCWGEKTSDYLARLIARRPQDLRSHVQRINLHIKLQDAEGAYSALLDLFVAVGDSGKSLRYRMLVRTRTLLDIHKYDALKNNMEQGINALTTLPVAKHSVLSMGLTGTHKLVEHLLDS